MWPNHASYTKLDNILVATGVILVLLIGIFILYKEYSIPTIRYDRCYVVLDQTTTIAVQCS